MSDMSFAWPWCFLVLPLPWLLRRVLAEADGGTALRVPSLPAMPAAASAPRATPWLAALAWLLLVAAAARPQLPDEPRAPPVSGRDLFLAFDVSASMAIADLRLDGRPVARLVAARRLADDFLARRQGDRVGLIVFGQQAYLHTPLSFDLAAVRAALAGAEVGLAGRETALGDAVALATKHLQGLPAKDRVLIVLTDGANTAGTLTPERAAWLARREGVRIHVVGIGGAQSGNDGVDEANLRDMAERSGGSYQRATDAEAIAAFWRHLDAREPTVRAGAPLRPQRELYAWPLALALLLAAWLVRERSREAAA